MMLPNVNSGNFKVIKRYTMCTLLACVTGYRRLCYKHVNVDLPSIVHTRTSSQQTLTSVVRRIERCHGTENERKPAWHFGQDNPLETANLYFRYQSHRLASLSLRKQIPLLALFIYRSRSRRACEYTSLTESIFDCFAYLPRAG